MSQIMNFVDCLWFMQLLHYDEFWYLPWTCEHEKVENLVLSAVDPHRFASMHVHRSITEVHRFISKCIGQLFKSKPTILFVFVLEPVAI